MAKEVVKKIKLQIPAGKATPAPPVGTVLGPAGINLQEFCTRYNDATRDKMGDIIPCEVSVYEDRTFDFVLKTPPAADSLKKIAGISKGGVKGANETVATITKEQLRQVAEIKLPDLNTNDIEKAMNIVAGTARNMGIAVKGLNDEELAEQALEAKEAEAEAKANKLKANSITDELIRMKEAEARLKHGWVTVQSGNAAVVTEPK